MIPIAITAAAYFHAICSTMPEDRPLWPVDHRDGDAPHPHIEAAGPRLSEGRCAGRARATARFKLPEGIDVLPGYAFVPVLTGDKPVLKWPIKQDQPHRYCCNDEE
jgi:hypothetical protein